MAESVAAGGGGERLLLFDFGDGSTLADWIPVNDVVMGGVSSGRLEASGHATAVFAGSVSLDRGGGFASVRSRPRPRDLRRFTALELRLRGDGRRYKVNLKSDRDDDGILYRVAFASRPDAWQTLLLPFEEFRASFRGRLLPQAPALDLSRVLSVGLMISDRQAGPFRLEIARIEAYAARDPVP